MSFLESLIYLHLVLCASAIYCCYLGKESNYKLMFGFLCIPVIGPLVVIILFILWVLNNPNLFKKHLNE